MVERGGLENRCARKRTEGSNPSLSANREIPYGNEVMMKVTLFASVDPDWPSFSVL